MRCHGAWTLVVAALAAGAPAAARAFEYTGRLGLAYDRIETWSGPSYSLVPRLRLDGMLETRGFFVEPGVLDWSGRVGYDDSRSTYSQTSVKGNGLTYGATVGLLQKREAKGQLAASVSRSRSDYATDVAAVRTTGTATGDAFGIRGGVAPPGLPVINSGFTYTDSVSSGLGRGELRETGKVLDLSMQFGQPRLDSRTSYRMLWESGTLPSLNYTAQQVGLQATANPADGLTGQISASYFLREPKELGGANPRYEDTLVGGTLEWGHVSQTHGGVRYQYTHASATDPSLVFREIMANTATVGYGRPISTEWRWSASGSASLGQTRVGGVQSSAAGQSAGLGADFATPAYGASFGARVGLFEPEHGSTALAYGGNASGRASWQRVRHLFNLTYSVTYDSNLDAAAGWSTTQSLLADATRLATGFLSWTARLQASAARSGGGAFGANASRSIVASGTFSHRRSSLGLEAGLSDSLTGALANPLSDGLFIPAGYNTHARYAAATATVLLTARLSFEAIAKFAILSGPATPDQREALYSGALRYAVGFWTFSLEDRYTMGGTTSFDHRINELYVRASRTFGAR